MVIFTKKFLLLNFNKYIARNFSNADIDKHIRYLRRLTGYPHSLCKYYTDKQEYSWDEARRQMHFNLIKDTADGNIPEYLKHKGLLGIAYNKNILCSLRVDCSTYEIAESKILYDMLAKCLAMIHNIVISNYKQMDSNIDNNIDNNNEYINNIYRYNDQITKYGENIPTNSPIIEHKLDNNKLFSIKSHDISIGDIVNSASKELDDSLVVSKGLILMCPKDVIVGIQSFCDNPDNIPSGELRMKMGNIVGASFIRPFEKEYNEQDMQDLANSIALHICGMMPMYINPFKSDLDDDALMTQPYLRIHDFLVEDVCQEENIEILEFFRDEILT